MMTSNNKEVEERSMELHRRLHGKITMEPKVHVGDNDMFSLVYSPGVAAPCMAIHAEPDLAHTLTMKGNTVAVVTDGTAVLGLGDIGPLAALPVMEGKAMLFKQFAGIDAFPICLDTTDEDAIVETVRRIAPGFGGINLEDISAPRCFAIERRLQDLGIPVFHDDQHGTAIVVLAALMNACDVVGKPLGSVRITINGAGAAGLAIASMLRCANTAEAHCLTVGEVLVCDSKGIIDSGRKDLNEEKRAMLKYTNPHDRSGTLRDALRGSDVFIGVSRGNLLNADDVRSMAHDPIIFALANPTPEIEPHEALAGGAAVVATGRSDHPNQVNNVLVFPGLFRGALDARAKRITAHMQMAAAFAIAACVKQPAADRIIPSALDKDIADKVADAVCKAAREVVPESVPNPS